MAYRRNETPLEAQEQTYLFQWASDMGDLKWPELHFMYAIPNGGSRHKLEAANLKKQGVKSGVPDVMLPVARQGYHGLYIEMKRRRGGTLSADQKNFIKFLQAQGYRVERCNGFHAAADVIEDYMTNEKEKRNG